MLWADGAVCPHCGGIERVTKVKANPAKRIRFGLWRCGDCKGQFTVKMGTVFEHARIPLHKMLQAVYLMTSSKKGIGAHQLHRALESPTKPLGSWRTAFVKRCAKVILRLGATAARSRSTRLSSAARRAFPSRAAATRTK